MTGLPPADTCHALLAALDDTTPDAIGISAKRQILEQAVLSDPAHRGETDRRLRAIHVLARDRAPSEDRTP